MGPISVTMEFRVRTVFHSSNTRIKNSTSAQIMEIKFSLYTSVSCVVGAMRWVNRPSAESSQLSLQFIVSEANYEFEGTKGSQSVKTKVLNWLFNKAFQCREYTVSDIR
jgi:hypothetical protein